MAPGIMLRNRPLAHWAAVHPPRNAQNLAEGTTATSRPDTLVFKLFQSAARGYPALPGTFRQAASTEESAESRSTEVARKTIENEGWTQSFDWDSIARVSAYFILETVNNEWRCVPELPPNRFFV